MSRFIQVLEGARDPFANMTKEKYGKFKKNYTIEFFGHKYQGDLSLYPIDRNYGPATDKQREWIKDFEKNHAKYSAQVFKQLLKYIDKLGDYKDYFEDVPIPKTEEEMGKIVTPRHVIVNKERNLIIDCNAKWDPEHGVTIQILPSINCGELGQFF